MTTILDLSEVKARDFLLKEDSYSNIDLPEYFTFKGVLDNMVSLLKTQKLSDNYSQNSDGKAIKPENCDKVNYKLITNKDGLYAWRPFQLIHPALYVDLVNIITEVNNWKIICDRFTKFRQNEKIQCVSIPVVSTDPNKTQKSKQILAWWKDVEQASLAKALDFSYLYVTDITDCYGSIYTHSVAWALHGKEDMKLPANRDDKKIVGNLIDRRLRDMSYGQTNGIPQGSILMDFIAEMILGYADLELSQKLNEKGIQDYHIIRYRDDYRIFVNNQTDGDNITKILTEVLIDLGLKLNSSKTSSTKDLIVGSIKKDKWDLLMSLLADRFLKIFEDEEEFAENNKKKISSQKLLLQIYDFANKHTNSGQLKRLLTILYERMEIDCTKDNVDVLISIVVNLAYNNPSIYPLCAAIISKIFECISEKEKKLNYIERINKKFQKLPNTGFMDIWLQRISYKISPDVPYSDKLCEVVKNKNAQLWNSNWLNDKFKKAILKSSLINEKIIEKMTPVITQREVDTFQLQYNDFSWEDIDDIT